MDDVAATIGQAPQAETREHRFPPAVPSTGSLCPANTPNDPSPPEEQTLSVSIHRRSHARRGNEPLDSALTPAERERMTCAAAAKLEELFDILQIDHRNDHNTQDTPRRVARMFVEELLKGRFVAVPPITEFENASGFDDMIVTGPIELRSTCAHHLMPIHGHAFVGVVPTADGKVIGLSKYDRIVEHFAARLQIQEELVKQIGSYIVEHTSPRGLAVRISATHMCRTHRGVRAGQRSRMVTTAYFGAMADDHRLKDEFLRECIALEGSA
jgi:GTP cyclohydrolase I